MGKEVTVHNTGISLLLWTRVRVILRDAERLDRRLNDPVHGLCGERRSPKVQTSTRPGTEPGTSWLAVRVLANCVRLAQARLCKFNAASTHGTRC